MLTDPVADMLTRIRNANKALHDSAEMPASKLKVQIARILKEEGYIRDYHVSEEGTHPTLVVELKYGRGRERVLSGLKRVSKPGRRIYAGKDPRQRVLGDMGIDIGFDYDNISNPLRLQWSEAGYGATWDPYPAVGCGGV